MSNPVGQPKSRVSARGLTRRRVLVTGIATSLASVLPGCGELPLPRATSGAQSDGLRRSAVLLPLSGQSAELGQRLRNAATLGGGPGIGIEIVDAGSSAETAVAAAKAAVAAGAEMLVGPVFSGQTEAVAQAVRVPVVSLSNNTALAGRRTFIFGVTPTQSAQAILSIAAQRGLSDVATVVPSGAFGAQSAAAAEKVGTALGLRMRPTLVRADANGLLSDLQADGPLPKAIYLPVADGTLPGFAEALRGQGIQLLGSTQWSSIDLSGQAGFRDAWFAAPDPLRFAAFDEAYREADGSAGGVITGLAFDGVELLRILGQSGQLTVRGLTRNEGFTGVIGPYRFLPSGLCERGLGVLKVGAGEFSLIGSTSV